MVIASSKFLPNLTNVMKLKETMAQSKVEKPAVMAKATNVKVTDPGQVQGEKPAVMVKATNVKATEGQQNQGKAKGVTDGKVEAPVCNQLDVGDIISIRTNEQWKYTAATHNNFYLRVDGRNCPASTCLANTQFGAYSFENFIIRDAGMKGLFCLESTQFPNVFFEIDASACTAATVGQCGTSRGYLATSLADGCQGNRTFRWVELDTGSFALQTNNPIAYMSWGVPTWVLNARGQCQGGCATVIAARVFADPTTIDPEGPEAFLIRKHIQSLP